MLRIALPHKGRLAADVRDLFRDAGLEVRGLGDRALTASLGDEFQALFVRAADIPEFVADGAADAGVTGWDLVCESERPLARRLDLRIGRCRLVVAAKDDGAVDSVDGVVEGTRVATSFPRLTRRFFRDRGRSVSVVPVSGATEVAPLLGIADVVVDLTSTGSTLRVNRLREIGTVLESTACLVTRAADEGARDGRARALDELASALGSVVAARDKRYLMANAPRARLADVQRILPGLNGPTVVDLLDGGGLVAVHAVVEAGAVYRSVAALREIGCEGILVTRIERLTP